MYHRVVFLFLLLLRSYRQFFMKVRSSIKERKLHELLLMHAIRSFLRYHKIQSIVVKLHETCNIVLYFLLRTHLLHASSSSSCS